MIFDQDQAGPPARQIEPAEHLKLVALDVDGQKIELLGCTSFEQNIIEHTHRNFDEPRGLRPGRHTVAIESRERSSHMQAHAPTCVLWRRAGNRENSSSTHAGQFLGQIGLRLDQHAPPAELLEVPGLRFLLRPVCPDLDEESRARTTEEPPHQRLLVSVEPGSAHR